MLVTSPRDKGDLTNKFGQVRVWYRWKGYLSGSMKNGCWGVTKGGTGHQRSSKVITQDQLKTKYDLTKNFDQPWTMCDWVLAVVEYVTRGHLRSLFKVM